MALETFLPRLYRFQIAFASEENQPLTLLSQVQELVDFIVNRSSGALHECLGKFNLCLSLCQTKELA